MRKTSDLHVIENRPLISPATIHSEFPITEQAATLVADTRDRVRNILRHEDQRLLAIVGPCSIHDVNAAMDYATRLMALRESLASDLEIVMRVYFEKPRTNVGWKGLINDPHLDNSYDINTGLRRARKLLLDLADMGMPAATEILDPITPQYLSDLISWGAIGARTTESQTHREMASGLSMPIGFKNSTDGSFGAAANAMLAASSPHHFLGINIRGHASIITTTGNPDTHMVLRGGNNGPNYDGESIDRVARELMRLNLNQRVMVDCSHGNSNKDYRRQGLVAGAIADQLRSGSSQVMGVMIESHLVAGNQPIPADLSQLSYGQSITDACIDFSTTVTVLESLAQSVKSTGVAVV